MHAYTAVVTYKFCLQVRCIYADDAECQGIFAPLLLCRSCSVLPARSHPLYAPRVVCESLFFYACLQGLDLSVKNFLTSVPLVADLRSPAMRERHWTQLMTTTKVNSKLMSGMYSSCRCLVKNRHPHAATECCASCCRATSQRIDCSKYVMYHYCASGHDMLIVLLHGAA